MLVPWFLLLFRQGAGCSAPFHRPGRLSTPFPAQKVLFILQRRLFPSPSCAGAVGLPPSHPERRVQNPAKHRRIKRRVGRYLPGQPVIQCGFLDIIQQAFIVIQLLW